MKVTIDGIEHEWDGSFSFKEGLAIEKVTGVTFSEWNDQLKRGSLLAMGALVWTILKRDNPNLRFDDVDYDLASFSMSPEEESGVDPTAPSPEPEPAT